MILQNRKTRCLGILLSPKLQKMNVHMHFENLLSIIIVSALHIELTNTSVKWSVQILYWPQPYTIFRFSNARCGANLYTIKNTNDGCLWQWPKAMLNIPWEKKNNSNKNYGKWQLNLGINASQSVTSGTSIYHKHLKELI